MIDPIAELRSSTASQHQATEELLPFTEASFSRGDYVRVLRGFLAAFEPLEDAVTSALHGAATPPHLADQLELGLRRRTPLLRADLVALGERPDAIAAAHSPSALHQTDWAAALGIMYVLEGSRLGGQVIVRNLMPRLGLTNETGGLSFLVGYGDRTGEMWRRFLAVLREHLTASAELAAAVVAAQQTFDLFAPASSRHGG